MGDYNSIVKSKNEEAIVEDFLGLLEDTPHMYRLDIDPNESLNWLLNLKAKCNDDFRLSCQTCLPNEQ